MFKNAPAPTPSTGRLGAAAMTLSVTAVILGATYASYRGIAARLKENGDKLNKIDPWTIYTAVAADFVADQER